MRPLQVQRVEVLRQRNGPPNSYSVLFPQAIVWAMLGGLMGFGVSLAKDRARGTLLRLLAAPIPPRAILLGKALACLLTLLTTASAIIVLGIVVVAVPVQNAAILLLALCAVAAVFTGLMLALTVIAKTEEAIGGGGWGVFMVLAMIGGNMIPLFLMPAWMQNVALVSPIRWAIVALEGAIWREYSLFEMLLPIAVLLALAAACFALASRLFQRDWLSP
jgi:ABC-2 type transport system permease protein